MKGINNMDKYDQHDHLEVLTELSVLYKLQNETLIKINKTRFAIFRKPKLTTLVLSSSSCDKLSMFISIVSYNKCTRNIC